MKGIIYVNAFYVPDGNIMQAQRLKREFNNKGVEIDIVSNGWENNCLINDKNNGYGNIDFAIFLDKDKYLSQMLEKCGVALFNSHESIRVCDDKGETVLALMNKGIKMPDTIFAPLCYKEDAVVPYKNAEIVAEKLGLPLIVKESYGSLGKGVYKADTVEEVYALMQRLKTKPHIYQKFISESCGKDIRVIVIGGKVICAMLRYNPGDFRSNIACGAVGEKIRLSDRFITVAERVANILKLDYCGVDLLIGKDDTPYVCEVNSNAFFKGIEKVTGVNVALAYANHVIEKIKNKISTKN